nr:dopamine beta-hydroxylase [Onthophagus taurus]
MKIILSILLLFITKCFLGATEKVFHVPLDQNSSITMSWQVNYEKELLIFEIHLPSDFGWFAFGFSDYGEPFPADYCILYHDWKQKLHFQDTYANDNGVLVLDSQQNCNNFRIKPYKAITKFTFQRKFDTCDFEDYLIEDGTTHIVWSRGKGPLYKASGLNISTHDSSMTRVQLLKNLNLEFGNEDIERNVYALDILSDKVQVPDRETTYWCHVHKLPEIFEEKHHVYRYESHIQKENEGIVHHMEVFHCIAPPNEDIPFYVGDCFGLKRPNSTQVCKRVIAAWAMGATMFYYPKEAGLPIGGSNFNKYIMLEIHYNNPMLQKGIIDSSGIRFYYSPKLRRYDAGIIELGLEYTDKMAIPPHLNSFALTGYCVSECTAISLPPDGINVFGSQLHTHLTGTKVWTRHIRDGYELMELNRDNHYSTHFQEIRRLKRAVKILPGDALITTCEYQTLDRTNITLGGFSISDEMCVNYIHYFPATTLEVCKSAISDQALSTFFEYMRSWEYQNIVNGGSISSNYNSIEWNPMRVELLKEVYKEAPLSMQCNMSSGDRFPGYWESTPLTHIKIPLPPPKRRC